MATPQFIKRENMIADTEYIQWLSDIQKRFRQSQAKAAVRLNQSMLEFYWSLGRDIIALQAESKWGSDFFNQLSIDLQQTFPRQKGFSVTNLKYVKRWYQFYYERITIRQQAADELQSDEFSLVGGENCQQVADELELPEKFAFVPLYHHVEIITKCQSLDEALFYITKCIENNWSREQLGDEIKANLFARQGGAITNFESTLPIAQQQLVQEILKDPYNFSFLELQQRHDEKQLEEALVNNITRFLLELGQGFSFVGRQMELQMPGGQTFFPDLIFYHIPQHRYVVVELKAVKYIPEFAGKLNFYVTAVDELMRGKGDNPTVGLVICKSTDKTVVEWSLKDICKPLGVATYQLEEVVERTVKELELNQK